MGNQKKEKKGNNTTPTKKDKERLAFVCALLCAFAYVRAHMGRTRKRLGSKYAARAETFKAARTPSLFVAGRISDWTKEAVWFKKPREQKRAGTTRAHLGLLLVPLSKWVLVCPCPPPRKLTPPAAPPKRRRRHAPPAAATTTMSKRARVDAQTNKSKGDHWMDRFDRSIGSKREQKGKRRPQARLRRLPVRRVAWPSW